MKTLTLSGWGQPCNALADVAPDATHFDYADFLSVEDALAGIAEAAKNHDFIIGWSLGGQLAVRAIAAGLMMPEKMVLIGVPFQFVRNENLLLGMPQDKFQKFRDNYEKNPVRTLAKASELVAMGDEKIEQIRAYLQKYNPQENPSTNWLHWLDMLNGFSCNSLDFNNFPPTLLLHGKQDAVVAHNQVAEFEKHIPNAKNISFVGAGHAPHWHDIEAVKRHIREF